MSGDSSLSTIKPPSARKGKSKDEGLWLLSFSDLCCILIAFFIMLLFYSKIDTNHYNNIQEGMQKETSAPSASSAAPKDAEPQVSIKRLSQDLKDALKKLHLEEKTQISLEDDGVALEFKDPLLFDTGTARGHPAFTQISKSIVALVASQTERLHVVFEGHTDDRSIYTQDFKNNWDLSHARGIALLKEFKQKGIPDHLMSIVSYGHTRPKIPYQNLTGEALEQARKANRRVVIRLQYQ